MNKYELTVILKTSLDEVGQKAEFDKIHALIERFGGTIEKVDEVGKRKLAYEINKQTEGIYNYITFLSDANVPAEVESRIRIMENVLRYLIIRVEE